MALTAQSDEVPATQPLGVVPLNRDDMMDAQVGSGNLVPDKEAVPANIEVPRSDLGSFALPCLRAAEPVSLTVTIVVAFVNRCLILPPVLDLLWTDSVEGVELPAGGTGLQHIVTFLPY